MAGHGFWGFTPKSLILPVVQRLAAHAYCFGYLACARAPGAQLDDCRPLLLLRVWCNDPNFANDAAPGVGDVCVDPGRERRTIRVTERLARVCQTPAVAQVVRDGDPLLLVRIPRFGAYIAGWQGVMTLIFAIPVLQCVLCRVAQLTEGGAHALAKFDVELYGPHAVCVRIHGSSPK